MQAVQGRAFAATRRQPTLSPRTSRAVATTCPSGETRQGPTASGLSRGAQLRGSAPLHRSHANRKRDRLPTGIRLPASPSFALKNLSCFQGGPAKRDRRALERRPERQAVGLGGTPPGEADLDWKQAMDSPFAGMTDDGLRSLPMTWSAPCWYVRLAGPCLLRAVAGMIAVLPAARSLRPVRTME